MLIGSSYVKDLFLNSVSESMHGLDIFLENSEDGYQLFLRHFSEISGKRFYEDVVEVVRGELSLCLTEAMHFCSIDTNVLREANLIYY